MSPTRIIVDVEEGYTPEDGDAFDAVRDALQHFEIPASVVEHTQHEPSGARDAVTLTLTLDEAALVAEALDSHLYWQVSEPSQRDSGMVYYEPTDDNAADCRAVERLSAKLARIGGAK